MTSTEYLACALNCRTDYVPRMLRTVLALALATAGCKRSEEAPPPPIAAPVAGDADRTFWAWFTANASSLGDDKDPVATVGRIQTELDKVDPDVYAELG